MSIAVIQGASGGLGLNLAAHILRHTSLKVYALTHQSSTTDLQRHLEQSSDSNLKDRLTVLGGIDNTQEDSLSKASKTIEEREGKASVRLIACLAGILHPEKSLSAFDAKAALETFNVNTIGHLLTYKHFAPLIPTRKEFKDLSSKFEWEESDPAKGLVSKDGSLCWSLSARVGSITDNEKGGWYSYRSSKAALNQFVRTLDHELINRSSSAVAVAYHPGTVLTSFSKRILGDKAKPSLERGILTPEQAIEHMTKVMSQVKREGDAWGGKCWDWKGDRVQW